VENFPHHTAEGKSRDLAAEKNRIAPPMQKKSHTESEAKPPPPTLEKTGRGTPLQVNEQELNRYIES